MNFRRGASREEPEINLIPMIDVLLVIIIFLMLTTTYSRFSGLEINLPTADVEQKEERSSEISVEITALGQILVNRSPLPDSEVSTIAGALSHAATEIKDPVIVINADAKAIHQRVIDVMQAAQNAGYPRLTFATQSRPPASASAPAAPSPHSR
ncbi:MAG: biopolymer transporter ExbD [Betaproteobacteria bacterium]|nr:biopolymer transporter ExbD [Betaproteobacteria bacterium]